MDVPCLFGTWEMLFGQYPSCLHCYCGDTMSGFGTQQCLISSCFADTLLLIVPHGYMRNFLIVGEKIILLRKTFMIPEYFLVFLGVLLVF